MRRYEMVFVADPTIPEAEHDRLLTGFEELIAEQGGTVHKVDRWGRRKLAYPIKKHNEGNYSVLLVEASPELEKEVLRRLKLSDQWLRFLSVRADAQALPSDEEKQALVEARAEYVKRATEREAAGLSPDEPEAPEGAEDQDAVAPESEGGEGEAIAAPETSDEPEESTETAAEVEPAAEDTAAESTDGEAETTEEEKE